MPSVLEQFLPIAILLMVVAFVVGRLPKVSGCRAGRPK